MIVNDQVKVSVIKVRDFKIEVGTNAKGKPTAKKMKLLSSGKNKGQYKIYENYYFASEEQRAARVNEWIKNINDQAKEKEDEMKKRADAKKNMDHGFEVGQIYYDSWGYDQTNIDFYKIVEVKERSVVMVAIGGKMMPSEGLSPMSGMIAPDPDVEVGERIVKVIQVRCWNDRITYFLKSKHGWISKYEKGEKGVYSSWYA